MSDYCDYVDGNCKYCEEGQCDFPIQGSGYPYEAPCFGYEKEDDEGELEILERLDTDSDMISRAKAIDGKICIRRSNGVEIYDDYVVPVEYLEQLPPAQPERIKGRWIKISPANIYECSECGKSVMTNDICAYDFCHGCGAVMLFSAHQSARLRFTLRC